VQGNKYFSSEIYQSCLTRVIWEWALLNVVFTYLFSFLLLFSRVFVDAIAIVFLCNQNKARGRPTVACSPLEWQRRQISFFEIHVDNQQEKAICEWIYACKAAFFHDCIAAIGIKTMPWRKSSSICFLSFQYDDRARHENMVICRDEIRSVFSFVYLIVLSWIENELRLQNRCASLLCHRASLIEIEVKQLSATIYLLSLVFIFACHR
jgi:hypothetical protein